MAKAYLKIEVRQFIPPQDDLSKDLRGNPMFAVAWAIEDPSIATEVVNAYVDRSISAYMSAVLDRNDPIVWDVFEAAHRATVLPVPVSNQHAF
jgi:hypothetical protein